MSLRATVASLLVSVALIGCEDSSGPSQGSIFGAYTLRTVNGANLPFTLEQSQGFRVEITAGTVTLRSDNTFSDTTVFRVTQGTSVSTTREGGTGVFQMVGGNVHFLTSTDEIYSMTLTGTSLTQSTEGFTLVYRK